MEDEDDEAEQEEHDLGAERIANGRCAYHVPPFELIETTVSDGRTLGCCAKCGSFIGYRK